MEATFSHSVPLVVSQSEGQESKSKSQQSSQILKSLQCLDEEGQSAEVVQAWLGEKRSNQNKNRARNEFNLLVVARHGPLNGYGIAEFFMCRVISFSEIQIELYQRIPVLWAKCQALLRVFVVGCVDRWKNHRHSLSRRITSQWKARHLQEGKPVLFCEVKATDTKFSPHLHYLKRKFPKVRAVQIVKDPIKPLVSADGLEVLSALDFLKELPV